MTQRYLIAAAILLEIAAITAAPAPGSTSSPSSTAPRRHPCGGRRESGALEWRFYTTSDPDHPDNRTWSGDSWRTGGAATWMTGSTRSSTR